LGTSVPALIAAVTSLSGAITGVHRTWLDPSGSGKAPVDTPRRTVSESSIEALTLSATLGDFNDDLRRLGASFLRDGVAR
jgi:hypothetical protein